jgi:hypothetical protein
MNQTSIDKNEKNINKKRHIVKFIENFIKFYLFEKTKLITKKLLCPQKINLTIVTGSAK